MARRKLCTRSGVGHMAGGYIYMSTWLRVCIRARTYRERRVEASQPRHASRRCCLVVAPPVPSPDGACRSTRVVSRRGVGSGGPEILLFVVLLPAYGVLYDPSQTLRAPRYVNSDFRIDATHPKKKKKNLPATALRAR
jgi:hypothetical protein